MGVLHEDPDSNVKLTSREVQILQLAAEGETIAQIAKELHISRRTVCSHIENILFKMQVKNRIQAIILAYKLGLIDLSIFD